MLAWALFDRERREAEVSVRQSLPIAAPALHDKVHYIERGPLALDPVAMKRRVTKLAR
jgi:hypothetical protein